MSLTRGRNLNQKFVGLWWADNKVQIYKIIFIWRTGDYILIKLMGVVDIIKTRFEKN